MIEPVMLSESCRKKSVSGVSLMPRKSFVSLPYPKMVGSGEDHTEAAV